ncbi:cation diffusion facilitator family transporter [Aurantimonas sp. VKM B-3413]|uniref:cation diffusion facilitator family transporter n=1 Tax=Aurantimonas sp. VKM B-3413 TaxID=2779401 RepID=UPI001E30300A|nr:cation diffusion facilitator family transporter [Aurantimonas sp. VKM B-3413]MCB8836187.1 cation diffusion facilitator family transporter [Aurantimonas sp. VKM B-3413]
MATSKQRASNPDSSGGSKGAVIAAGGANLAIAVTKLAAAFFTGSSSMFAEGIHSLIDTANQGFLLIGLAKAKKPADRKHPFGYGSEVYFWSFLVAIFIFALGAGFSIYEGVAGLMAGESELTSPLVALGVLFLAFCFEGYSWSVAFREFNAKRGGRGIFRDFRDMKDPSIFVVLFEDSAACIGVVIAGIGVGLSWSTGIHQFDAIGSILIGVLLGVTAVFLAIEVKGLLVGEAADPQLDKVVREGVAGIDEVIAVNELRTLHLGPSDVLLTISVDFRDDVVSQRIEEIVSEIERRVRRRFTIVRRVFIEVQSQSGHAKLAERADGGMPEALIR